ncbi:thiol-disulfide oxidoreductase DCC family protein [Hymenobacter sp. BRD128]|uniref:thiol-disulfide oxidoreductase DCC family protein n=1 Tax=Hymenobacter sp. BRD128 TaxID=2675878 RepID=UPI001564111B|nr:thiol-disulfide oxidoreductase DCC family protein [Hymenobacter sp. BRD128]QKG56019.1 thiol-disulfide oxidoreductase DCC family protein [Hymenobacter sp. BRD128]
MAASASATILFDGVCTLCNGFVQFVIRHDARGYFRFAALQSELGQALLAAHGQPATAAQVASPDSVILLEGGQLYAHSAAVLRIARQLGGPWRLAAAVGGWLPRRGRDAAYRFVARHRYRWFGRQESCLLPTPALRARFL